jgi:hypothetical protein
LNKKKLLYFVYQITIQKNESSKVISITNQQLTYPVALILSTTRKTCAAMASLAGKSGDTFCQLGKISQSTRSSQYRKKYTAW